MNIFQKFFLLLFCGLFFSAQAQNLNLREVALLDLTSRNSEAGLSRIRSCRHILQTAGLPYTETIDVAQAIQYPVIFVSPVIFSYTFTSDEKTLLTNYVHQGGVLIASSLRDPALYSLFGVSGYTNYSDITSMTWDIETFPQYFDRFDDPNEITISLRGESSSSESFIIRPYNTIGSAQHLATLNNGGKAVVMNTFGQGRTFLFSIDLRDVIIRNQINGDINAQRSYSNGFEPTSDSFIFFVSNIITQHIPHIPRVHTCPDCESSVVMITHDIDSRTAMDTMSIFIDYEEQNNLHAMYNVTTRIYDDEWMSDFYNGTYSQVEYAKLHGQKLASHSLGHFIDFADVNLFPLGTIGNTPANYMPLYFNGVTTGGSVFGETEVSKYLLENDHGVQIKSFRAGHLAYNKRLPKALTDLGYLYNSTFSANDVLTNFPFYTTDNLTFSGQQMPVLEIPMTISDAAASVPFTQENALERAALWVDVALKNNSNGAPTILLVHPNRGYKLPAEQYFVNAMPADVKFMFLDDFGDYWKKRETAGVTSTFQNDSLIIQFSGFEVNSPLSLVVKDADVLAGIVFYDGEGQQLFPQSLNVTFNETRYCHFQYASNVEVCNGIDDNGNGSVDENLGYVQYADQDQDGYGNVGESIIACQPQLGYVQDNTDCNDQSTVIHPNNAEYCDQLDNDCDEQVDEGLNWQTYYWDADEDGFGNDNASVSSCLAPLDYNMQNGDCNDDDSAINPAQNEVCNDQDDNCDLNIDEGLAFVEYYEDLDQDGFGNSAVAVTRCILPFGFVPQHGDCNDNHFATYPNASESCDDEEDNDCDGSVNEGCIVDADADGYSSEVDCNDGNNTVFPGAEELCENNIDENCDGLDEACPVFGCTNPIAFNYNPAANTDDGSCVAVVLGCTDVVAFNYNPAANTDDGSCVPVVLGCTDAVAFNYNPAANTDDGSCVPVVLGCTDAVAFNYNPAANTEDGSCVAVVFGCTDAAAFNYNPAANTDDGSCVAVVLGCTDVVAFNYNPAANTEDGSCVAVVLGCTDALAFNYNPSANTNDGSCVAVVLGCTESAACNYNTLANTDDGSCILSQPEVCNSLDDNCNNQVDEGLSFVNYYNDNDGDGQGTGIAINACASPGAAYVTITGDCDDNNAAINSNATEICDAFDNDCDGTINDGLRAVDINAINVNTALHPICSGGNLFSANLNTGINSALIQGEGPDLWYRLNAQYNTLRVGLSAASGTNSITLFQNQNGCLQELISEQEFTTGNQTLLTDDLQVGGEYFIAVHQVLPPANNSAKVCFGHLTSTTCDHVYSNYTGVYPNVCASFKAQYKTFALSYIFNVLSCSQNGLVQPISPWSYSTPSSSSVISRLGVIFPVNQSGFNRTYTLSIPVVYGLTDAAGNLELLTAQATSSCSLVLSSESAVALRLADRCPNIKAINQSVVTDRSICGTLRYEWEFTQTAPTAGLPVTVLGGLNSTALFLNTVPGMANGKTYNVRVRPIHTTGEVGNYGAVQCMKTTGAGMVMEDHPGAAEQLALSTMANISLFPNPTVDGQVTLMWHEFQEGQKELVLRDVQGRVVWKEKVALEGNVMELDWRALDTGIYLLEVDGETMRVIKG